MKPLIILFAASTLLLGKAHAQAYYEPIPYYGDNPFLFCTIGVPQDCWLPIDPVTGAFTVTNPYCFNPVSAAQFARVCPHAFKPSGTAAAVAAAAVAVGAGAAAATQSDNSDTTQGEQPVSDASTPADNTGEVDGPAP